MNNHCDIAVIGAGPAGLLFADEVGRCLPDAQITVFDRGNPIEDRLCPVTSPVACADCDVCDVACGVGGAGLYSDGKLVLSASAGGVLVDLVPDPIDRERLVSRVEDTLLQLDGLSERIDPEPDAVSIIRDQLARQELEFKPYSVRHLGSENLRSIVSRLFQRVASLPGITFRLRTTVLDIAPSLSGLTVRYVGPDGSTSTLLARRVVLACGKDGQSFVERVATSLGVPLRANLPYLGVRIEMPESVLAPAFEVSLDPKIVRAYPGITRIKTHCACRTGEVIPVRYGGRTLIGGHTRWTANNAGAARPDSSNVNVLAQIPSKAEAEQALAHFQSIGAPHLQTMSSFLQPIEQQDAQSSAHLFDALPAIFECLQDFLRRLDQVFPGLIGPESRVFAPACEWLGSAVEVNRELMTAVDGLYAVGDGAGLSQGVVQSGAMALLAADAVCGSMEHGRTAGLASTCA